MSAPTLKVVIPMAGFGSRLRPLTWSRPKALLTLADKSVLAHVLDMLQTLPNPDDIELIFIIGYLGDQFEPYMRTHYPHLRVHYVQQPEMLGQSHAIYLAKEYLSGPMLMIFSDTLIESDLSFLAHESSDAVAWVKEVPDPRRFGIAVSDASGRVTRLVEKPSSMDNKQAVVGFYYFKDSQRLIAAIEEQMRRKMQLKGEYFLADAVNLMLEDGMHMRTQPVNVWLDAGLPAAMLETNAYLLEHGHDNSAAALRPSVTIVPPVYIAPDAEIHNAVIGPYATIGAGCTLENVVVKNSIIEANTTLRNLVITDSMAGERASITGRVAQFVAADNSTLEM
ncbi:MAG: sugar phosphate nucleotidyltransferase [Anaerolineales bacterium]